MIHLVSIWDTSFRRNCDSKVSDQQSCTTTYDFVTCIKCLENNLLELMHYDQRKFIINRIHLLKKTEEYNKEFEEFLQ